MLVKELLKFMDDDVIDYVRIERTNILTGKYVKGYKKEFFYKKASYLLENGYEKYNVEHIYINDSALIITFPIILRGPYKKKVIKKKGHTKHALRRIQNEKKT